MTDIRTDPEVQRVCGDMGIQGVCRDFPKCGRCTIRMSIGDLAFWMRDQCIEDTWLEQIYQITGDDSCIDTLASSTPREWIRAACKAWGTK